MQTVPSISMVPSGWSETSKSPRSSSPEAGSVSRREPPPGPEVPGAVTECLSRGTAAPLTVYETARALCRSASTARSGVGPCCLAALGNGAMKAHLLAPLRQS